MRVIHKNRYFIHNLWTSQKKDNNKDVFPSKDGCRKLKNYKRFYVCKTSFG